MYSVGIAGKNIPDRLVISDPYVVSVLLCSNTRMSDMLGINHD